MVKPNPLAVAVVLLVPGVVAWAILIYACHTIVTAAAVVINLISRSL